IPEKVRASFYKLPEVVSAWIDRFQAGLGDWDDVPDSARVAFLKDARVLDAWVERHSAAARQFLESMKSIIKQRTDYVPLPVVADGHIIDSFVPNVMKNYLDIYRSCVLIRGEGGAGKTSLAYQIAKWTLNENPIERPCAHKMIPVILEAPGE